MKTFEFNEHNACLNANKYVLLEKRPIQLIIKTAHTGKGWVYGYNISTSDWGSHSGCSNGDWEKLFADEKSAFMAAIDTLKNGRNKKELLKQHLTAMEGQKFFPPFQQLELF